jgi:integrase
MVSAALPALRAMLMTLYASGARNAELTRLKFSDFDKQRMVVHIQGGKGRKDRVYRTNPDHSFASNHDLTADWRNPGIAVETHRLHQGNVSRRGDLLPGSIWNTEDPR